MLLVVIVIVVTGIWFWLPHLLDGDLNSLSERGQFGDSYGAVNALFTGLAFAGLLFTILLQQHQLRLQRIDVFAQIEQMQLARQEAAQQSALQAEQIRLGKLQIRLKPLEIDLELIKMKSLQWSESARYGYTQKDFEQVASAMREIVNEIHESEKRDAA